MTELLSRTFNGRRVLVTGHTGFKGGWLSLWLRSLGADVTGFALPPSTHPSFFEMAGLAPRVNHRIGDLRDTAAVRAVLEESQPEFVFHLAAQPLVRRSYEEPLETIQTNVLGTAHLLEQVRRLRLAPAILVVTSDKCYENREWMYAYRENDALGGHDVYSMSKAATELVTASYRSSFFSTPGAARIATARAGNVIGGGDWAEDRIVPDSIRALSRGEKIRVRSPRAVRPWQHVLESLGGYLQLAATLSTADPEKRALYCSAWNFGPHPEDAQPVASVVDRIIEAWGEGGWTDASNPDAPHEAHILRLSIEKSVQLLGWRPRWSLPEAIRQTVAWYKTAQSSNAEELGAFSIRQIHEFTDQ